jgi:S-layer family protein
MAFQKKYKTGLHIIFVKIWLVGIFGLAPMQASAQKALGPISIEKDCDPNGGWMWVEGPFEPEVAKQVKQELAQKGVNAQVEAKGYGEMNSCDTYHQQGIDFMIHLADAASRSAQPAFTQELLPLLTKYGKPGIGNVKLISAEGKIIPLNTQNHRATVQMVQPESLATNPITKKVYVVVYDPLLSNNQKLSQYLGWNDHATITQQTIDFFKQASNNRMNYVIAQTTIVTNGWPQLVDGFSYTEQAYLAVLAGQQPHHEPTGVDYNKIVNSTQLDICGKLNRGEIDEVWIYNGPWFGFYESRLVGPGAYSFNSPPVDGANNCTKLLPIMGPSPEREIEQAVHNFGHRTEATMAEVYGGWQKNNTSHNWNKFALNRVEAPSYSYGGCGDTHYPPNSIIEYEYDQPSSYLSNCADFAHYPNLSDPLQVSQPVSCSAWGCLELNYYKYWFSHLPSFTGCGPDNVANDWWKYFASPYNALSPSSACSIFGDVPPGYWARDFVERLYAAGITGGCALDPLMYCPETTVTRSQMAVFLERGIHGSSYNPPAVGASTGFGDVSTSYWASAWIKQLATEGITGGCGSGIYCPESAVTRAQMAIFLLRSKHGASYAPPDVGGSTGFSDVSTSYWAAAWIKQLVAEGITAGCGTGIYCPEFLVTRAQMAVFLVRTFGWP